jgi:hypothetical protein
MRTSIPVLPSSCWRWRSWRWQQLLVYYYYYYHVVFAPVVVVVAVVPHTTSTHHDHDRRPLRHHHHRSRTSAAQWSSSSSSAAPLNGEEEEDEKDDDDDDDDVVQTVYADFTDELRSLQCDDDDGRDFATTLSRPRLRYYPSDEDYNDWRWIDLLLQQEEQSPQQQQQEPSTSSFPQYIATADGRPRVTVCRGDARSTRRRTRRRRRTEFTTRTEQQHNGTTSTPPTHPAEKWYLQRVGPFRSTGGRDWWQFSWHDVFGLQRELLLQQEQRLFRDKKDNNDKGGGGESPPVAAIAITGHWTGPIAFHRHNDTTATTASTTSSGAWTPVGLPPLHVHHVHLAQDEGLGADLSTCLRAGVNCPDACFILMQHGDGQAAASASSSSFSLVGNDDDDTTRNDTSSSSSSSSLSSPLFYQNFGEDYRDGYAKYVYRPLSITAEINDFRPAGSPVLEWWYQIAIRVAEEVVTTTTTPATMSVPDDEEEEEEEKEMKKDNDNSSSETAESSSREQQPLIPLSVHSLANPSTLGLFGQLDRFLTAKVPPFRDSVLWYTGRLPFAGDLHQVSVHCHMMAHHQMFLFQGSPQDLGLDRITMVGRPVAPWVPTPTREALLAMGMNGHEEPAGGRNNQVIIDMMDLMTMKFVTTKSSSRHPTKNGTDAAAAQLPAQLICTAKANVVEIDGTVYDRYATQECIDAWSFEAGTQYTVVAFNGGHPRTTTTTTTTGPVRKSSRPRPGDADPPLTRLDVPPTPDDYTFPQHNTWFLTYRSRDGTSHYTWGQGSTDPDASSPVFSLVDMIRFLVYGTPKHAPALVDLYVLLPVVETFMAILDLFHPEFTWYAPFPGDAIYSVVVGLFIMFWMGFGIFLFVVRTHRSTTTPLGKGTATASSSSTTAAPRCSSSSSSCCYGSCCRPWLLEIGTYLMTSVTIAATLVSMVHVSGPKDVFLVNQHDQEHLRNNPQRGWTTGRPAGRWNTSVLSGCLVLLGLYGATLWLLRKLGVAEEQWRRLSAVATSGRPRWCPVPFLLFCCQDNTASIMDNKEDAVKELEPMIRAPPP